MKCHPAPFLAVPTLTIVGLLLAMPHAAPLAAQVPLVCTATNIGANPENPTFIYGFGQIHTTIYIQFDCTDGQHATRCFACIQVALYHGNSADGPWTFDSQVSDASGEAGCLSTDNEFQPDYDLPGENATFFKLTVSDEPGSTGGGCNPNGYQLTTSYVLSN